MCTSSLGPGEAGLAYGILPEADEPVQVVRFVKRRRSTHRAGQHVQMPSALLPAAEGPYTLPNVERGKAQYYQHTPGAAGILLCTDGRLQ